MFIQDNRSPRESDRTPHVNRNCKIHCHPEQLAEAKFRELWTICGSPGLPFAPAPSTQTYAGFATPCQYFSGACAPLTFGSKKV